MVFWLGVSENSQQWRRFLMLNQLDSQSALGDQADIATLQSILDRFEMDVDGLDSPAFVDVRNELRRQIKTLSLSSSVYDFKSEIEDAKFVPISADELEAYRQQTIFEYKSLENYYRGKMPSRERAELFYEIKSAETIDFLSELETGDFIPDVVIKIPGPDDDSESDEEKQTAKELDQRKKEAISKLRGAITALAEKNFELNDPYITSTRLSIERLFTAFAYGTNSRAEIFFDREIEKLKENIEGLQDPMATAKHAIVGDSLGRLAKYGPDASVGVGDPCSVFAA